MKEQKAQLSGFKVKGVNIEEVDLEDERFKDLKPEDVTFRGVQLSEIRYDEEELLLYIQAVLKDELFANVSKLKKGVKVVFPSKQAFLISVKEV
ncbi:MAG: hypothetical protein IJX96_02325 [Clostridia bacterium]|nr:hypothetical protein [Clostridia bacterium]